MGYEQTLSSTCSAENPNAPTNAGMAQTAKTCPRSLHNLNHSGTLVSVPAAHVHRANWNTPCGACQGLVAEGAHRNTRRFVNQKEVAR